MFGWLKSLTDRPPKPRKVAEIEAKLVSATGDKRHYGEVEYDTYNDGSWKLDLDIVHRGASLTEDLVIRFDGAYITTVTPKRQDATITRIHSSRSDSLGLTPKLGTQVEVLGAAGVIMSGVFAPED